MYFLSQACEHSLLLQLYKKLHLLDLEFHLVHFWPRREIFDPTKNLGFSFFWFSAQRNIVIFCLHFWRWIISWNLWLSIFIAISHVYNFCHTVTKVKQVMVTNNFDTHLCPYKHMNFSLQTCSLLQTHFS